MPRWYLPLEDRLASTLRHSWRAAPTPLAHLDPRIIEPAIVGGAGALLARRVDAATDLPDAQRLVLRDLVRHQTLEAARFEHGLEARLLALAEVGIRPILVKGWSIARQYPAKGLRHYSDLDLVVTKGERARAGEVLSRFEHDRLAVDLHVGVPHVRGRDAAALSARLRPVALGAAEVVTLGDEDHLWLLALHALGHGAWRPVWLCDLALLIENVALDWDYLFAGPSRDVATVKVALLLARDALGADAPAPFTDERLPSWTLPALYASWNEGARAYTPLTTLPAAGALWSEARRRWPNPIRATAWARGPWNEWPRAPLQLFDSLRRAARFAVARDSSVGIWKR